MTNKEWLDYLAHNAPDELAAWFDAEHVETEERALDGDTAPENADSRELILADLEKKTREWHDYDGNFMRIYSDVAYAQMKELLDRQAAITEEQARCKWVTASADEIAAWRSKAEKLKADLNTAVCDNNSLRYELECLEENKTKVWCDCDCCKWQEEREKLTAERDELQEQLLIGWECECRLQAERDNLADDLLTANRQREQYRKLFGMALDWAHEITMLESSVDEGMA